MPTTVVENSERVFSDTDNAEYGSYGPRTRRPVWLEGLGASANPCPTGYTYRTTGGRCFCDPVLESALLGALGMEIPCPASLVTTTFAPVTTIAPAKATTPTTLVPATFIPTPPATDETVQTEPTPPPPETVPIEKKTSPLVWVGAGAGALVIGWLFFRRKKGRR